MIAIKTPRLVLRKFLEKDVPGLLEYFKNPRVACFLDEKVENPDKMLEEIRRRNESPEGTELAVCIRESDNVIGNVFSRKEMEDTYSCEFSFQVQDPRRGCGVLEQSVPVPFSPGNLPRPASRVKSVCQLYVRF